jgi:hypothetical protein
MLSKQHALGGERIGIRRSHHLVADSRQAIAAPLVAGDQENVLSSAFSSQSMYPYLMHFKTAAHGTEFWLSRKPQDLPDSERNVLHCSL